MDESVEFNKDDIKTSHFTNDCDVKVHQLTLDIYSEFESILKTYGEKPLSSLVPLVANLLETLNSESLKKDKITVELDILKDHHTILMSKYESGKNDAKTMEEQLFSVEDELQEKRKKIESMEAASASTWRLMELKLKNSHDHIYRLEERESDLRTTYANLRERYGDLFRAHVDFLEKCKVNSTPVETSSMSPSSSSAQQKLGGTSSMSFLNEYNNACSSTTGIASMSVSHKGDSPYDWGARRQIMQTIYDTTPELMLDADGSPFSKLSVHTKQSNAKSSFKFSDDKFDESESVSEEKSEENEDIINAAANRQDSAVDFNVSREVSKLVRENNELEETKNALNVVIHDLLTQLEDVNCDKDQLRETLSQFQMARSSMQLHISGLEQEISRLKSELTSALEAQHQSDSEIGITPFSKRNRFTRDEMSKVLMERNQFKEDLYELRETLRWNEVLNARNQMSSSTARDAYGWQAGDDGNKFLSFFSRLFRRPRVNVSNGNFPSSVSFDRTRGSISEISGSHVRFSESDTVVTDNNPRVIMATAADGRVNEEVGKPLGPKSDGWIPIPVASQPCQPQPIVIQSKALSSSPHLAVSGVHLLSKQHLPPLPLHLYRRPIPEAVSGRMQVCSATCTYRDVGSVLPSGEVLAGRSTFFNPSGLSNGATDVVENPSYTDLTNSWAKSTEKISQFSTQLSHEIWMCLVGVVNDAAIWTSVGLHSSSMASSSHEAKLAFRSQIVVVDTDNPSRYVDSFSLPRSVVTCITAVPGASNRDYEVLRFSNAVWESIPFTNPQNEPPLAEHPPSDRQDESSTSSYARPTSPEPPTDTSIQTCNTLSSLRHFATVDAHSSVTDEDSSSSRSNAFQPVQAPLSISGGMGVKHDFYRVERQRFVQRPTSASSLNQESRDLADSSQQGISVATAQQTVWLGCQNGDIFLHCSMTNRKRCLQTTRLPSGVTSICNFSGRVFVSLANGHVAVFRRQSVSTSASIRPSFQHPPSVMSSMKTSILSEGCHEAEVGGVQESFGLSRSASQDLAITTTTPHSPILTSFENELSIDQELAQVEMGDGGGGGGSWDLSESVVITCGPPGIAAKCMVVVPPALTIWVACGAEVLVIDTTGFQKLVSFTVQSKSGSLIKCMSWIRDGVWISLRTEPIVRLYNAFTNEPLQELDIQSILMDTLGAPNGSPLSPRAFSVTALGASPDHLWVGSKCGAVMVAPFELTQEQPSTIGCPDKFSTPKSSIDDEVSDEEQSQSTPVRRVDLPDVPSVPSPIANLHSSGSSAMVDLSGASVSMYGHAEAVNFFTLVSGSGPPLASTSLLPSSNTVQRSSSPLQLDKYLMLSGGVGFVNHRKETQVLDCGLTTSDIQKTKQAKFLSHLLAWSVSTPSSCNLLNAPFTSNSVQK